MCAGYFGEQFGLEEGCVAGVQDYQHVLLGHVGERLQQGDLGQFCVFLVGVPFGVGHCARGLIILCRG